MCINRGFDNKGGNVFEITREPEAVLVFCNVLWKREIRMDECLIKLYPCSHFLFTEWQHYWVGNTSWNQLRKRHCTALIWWASSPSKLTGSDGALNSVVLTEPFCWAELWSLTVPRSYRTMSLSSGRAYTACASFPPATFCPRRANPDSPKRGKYLQFVYFCCDLNSSRPNRPWNGIKCDLHNNQDSYNWCWSQTFSLKFSIHARCFAFAWKFYSCHC